MPTGDGEKGVLPSTASAVPRHSGANLPVTEMEKALALHSPTLVTEIHDIARREIAEEQSRFENLEAKAASIRGQMGIAVTVATAVGGTLSQVNAVRGSLGHLAMWVVGAFALSLVTGALSTLFAVLAFRVKILPIGISEEVVFNKEALSTADSQTDQDAALTVYRRYLVSHYWQIRRAYFDGNERKAVLIRWSQDFFAGFVALLAIAGLLCVVAAIPKLRD